MDCRIIIWVTVLMFVLPGYSQTVDQRVEELIQQKDWFTLDEEYPQLKGGIQSPVLKSWAEMMLKMRFNVLPQVMDDVDHLLMNYQQELDYRVIEVCVNGCKILKRMGYYGYAADRMNDLNRQLLQFTPRDSILDLLEFATHFDRLRQVEPCKYGRPDADVEVPMTLKKVGRGMGMFIPVKIRGKVYDFLLDTGTSGFAVSQIVADELGINTILDSAVVSGAIGNSIVKIASLDTVQVGSILGANFLVHILPPNPGIDTVYQIVGIVGTDFLNLIGECRIYPQEGKVVFPWYRTPLPASGRNMIEDEGRYYLKVFSGDEKLKMFFDTGNVESEMFSAYYAKHRKEIDSNGRRDTVRGMGIGGIEYRPVLYMDSLPMRLNDTGFCMKNIPVSLDRLAYEVDEDGELGMTFINLFSKIIINFKEMFVQVESK